MTTEDIKSNPVLFEKKYRRLNTRLAELNEKVSTKIIQIENLKAQVKQLRAELTVFKAKDKATRARGEQLAEKNLVFSNKVGKLFEAIQPYYPECSFDAVKRRSRKREIVEPRHLMCYFLREKYRFSWKLIGKIIGGRDHSSCINSYNRVVDLCAFDRSFRTMVDKLKEEVKNI
jgi:chromosomal replication initiation ATPase DnaA